MNAGERFFDTNILLYLLSEDQIKADIAESILSEGGMVSVQVFNEFASVALRKLNLTCPEIREILITIEELCIVAPLTLVTHSLALDMVERHGFAVYDALIVASALENGCKVLFTEDLQHGLRVERKLAVRNPFIQTA